MLTPEQHAQKPATFADGPFVHVETVYMIWCDACGDKVGESRSEELARERADEHSRERFHG